MSSEKLQIEIKTVADTSGAKAASQALGDVSKAAERGGSTAKDTGKNVNALGESYEKGASAGRVLNQALKGNITSFGQLGSVMKAVGSALLANPLLTIGAIAASLILPALQSIVSGWKSVGEQAAESGKAAADAAEQAVKSISERRSNELAEAYREIADRANEARAAIDAVSMAQATQLDADEAVALAEINAATDLSETERAQRTAAVRRDFRGRRSARELAELDERDAVSARGVASANDVAQAAARDEAAARRFVSSTESQSPAALRRRLAEQEAAQAALLATSPQNPEEVRARDAALEEGGQNLQDTRVALAEATANHAQRMATAEAALEAATKARADAEAKAAAVAQAAAIEANTNVARRAVLNIRGAADQRVEELQAPAILAEAARKDAERSAAAQLAGERDLLGADAQNVGARTAVKLGGRFEDQIDPAVIAAATEKARALADGDPTRDEGQSLVDALGPLLMAIEKIPGQQAAQEKANYTAVLNSVRELTRRLGTVESQMKNARIRG